MVADSLKITTSHTLRAIAKQAESLALGLQNAAPPGSGTGKSVQYLSEIAKQLEELAQVIDPSHKD